MSRPKVTVCACTYRRPDGLKNLLDGLAGQTFTRIPPPDWDIVIADNEGSEEAKEVCEAFRRDCEIPLTYVHEPRRGIPQARNACLDQLAPSTDFFAMIDDDEIPEPDWLEQLLIAQATTGADVVQGRVVPEFPPDVPEWIKQGGFFGVPRNDLYGNPQAWTDGQVLDKAATNNVLVRWPPVRALALRFDERLALTGGSDTLFFCHMSRAGLTIAYAGYAEVRDHLPANRLCLAYLLRGQYRRGHNKLQRKLALRERSLRRMGRLKRHLKRVPKGLRKIVEGFGAVAICIATGNVKPDRLARCLMRSSQGVGMLASVFGVQNNHYR